VGEDIERVRKVREAVGPDMEIRFDANQGYTAEEAVLLVRETAGQRIELLEQPTPRAQARLLGWRSWWAAWTSPRCPSPQACTSPCPAPTCGTPTWTGFSA